jgi:hypothetical protein
MLEVGFIIAIILVGVYAVIRLYERWKNQEEKEEEPVMDMEEEIKTRELAITVLKDIGADLKDIGENRVWFEYQGITFLMDVEKDCCFVNIIWPWCHTFNKFDIEEFSRVRRVMNDINRQEIVSVFYDMDDSDDVVLHIKKNLLLVPQIPQIDGYLRSILNSFFTTARTLDFEIEKSRLQENKECL